MYAAIARYTYVSGLWAFDNLLALSRGVDMPFGPVSIVLALIIFKVASSR